MNVLSETGVRMSMFTQRSKPTSNVCRLSTPDAGSEWPGGQVAAIPAVVRRDWCGVVGSRSGRYAWVVGEHLAGYVRSADGSA